MKRTRKRFRTIKVTRKLIMEGWPMDSGGCPIALALTRAGFNDVSVGKQCASTSERMFDLPEVARRFICAFDYAKTPEAKRLLKPFSFRLREWCRKRYKRALAEVLLHTGC